jgi:hypothetical protein
MAQEFTINSSTIEQKINQLLPSQGGMGAGIDFSASTMVIPIVDITESASGSALREDLQTCVDFATTRTTISGLNVDIIATTGFYKVDVMCRSVSSGADINILINDGTTNQTVKTYSFTGEQTLLDSFVVFLRAGDTLRGSNFAATAECRTHTRQIADITGSITSPLGFNT